MSTAPKRKIEEGWDGFGADPNETMQWLHSSTDVIEEPGNGLVFDEYNPAFMESVINEIVDPDWGTSGLSLSEQMNNPQMLVPQTPISQPTPQMQTPQFRQLQPQTPQPTPQQPQTPSQPQQFVPQQNTLAPNLMVARNVLSTIEEVARSTNAKLHEIAQHQKQIVDRPTADLYSYLSKTQKQLEAEITNGYNQLQQMLDGTYLDCNEMTTVLALQKQQSLQKKQLELYIEELEGLLKDNSVPRLALVLVGQPFPNSVKQNAKIDEPVIVQLLTGAKSNIKPNCVIKAEIISGASGKKSGRNAPIKIENAEKQLNDQGVATFNDMKFPIGTRLKSIRFKCTTHIKLPDRSGQMHSIELETLASNSIVVKTNENQWGEAEGILLKKTIFDGRSEIPWHRFANWLQRRYVLGTRQNLQSPTRPLNVHDFRYIHRTKFDSKPLITQAQFDKFWEWFGPLLHKIRHQRYMAQLWTKGYISGFLSREEVDPVLRNEKIGTFIIRFSENRDTFAISYQAGDDSGLTRVKHYLIKSDDTHGAKKNMADFLREFRDLTILLQLFTEKGTDRRILCRCQKDEALSEFYSKKTDASCDGYDDDIDVQ